MDKIEHPPHYGGADNPYEVIKLIEGFGLGFCGGNALKYMLRAGRKSGELALHDLGKALWYLERAAKNGERSHCGGSTFAAGIDDILNAHVTPAAAAVPDFRWAVIHTLSGDWRPAHKSLRRHLGS